jgi:hypothetical protein
MSDREKILILQLKKCYLLHRIPIVHSILLQIYDPTFHRIYCFGHIINLAAQSFLFTAKDEDLQGEKSGIRIKATEAEIQAWRKKGPLGKPHNINIWINCTEQRLQTFLKCSKNHQIPRDNQTRWNLWQRQIDKAINKEIIEGIDLYLDAYGDSDVVSDRLDEEEWKSLGKINDMLSVLKEATKSLGDSVVSLTKGLPAMD